MEWFTKIKSWFQNLNNVDSKGFNDLVAQLGHFVAGGWCVANSQLHWGHAWPGLLIIGAWVGIKEYVYDAKVEHQGFWDNTLDAAMYMGGAVVQTLLLKP